MKRNNFSFWVSLILASALLPGCATHIIDTNIPKASDEKCKTPLGDHLTLVLETPVNAPTKKDALSTDELKALEEALKKELIQSGCFGSLTVQGPESEVAGKGSVVHIRQFLPEESALGNVGRTAWYVVSAATLFLLSAYHDFEYRFELSSPLKVSKKEYTLTTRSWAHLTFLFRRQPESSFSDSRNLIGIIVRDFLGTSPISSGLPDRSTAPNYISYNSNAQ